MQIDPVRQNPGVRPIGVGEVLRRIISKAITTVLRQDLQSTAGGLQLCVGQEGGSEAGIHAMVQIYDDEDTHGIIQVDAENAFNTINRNVLLQNLNILCPEIALYTYNCYQTPARLFVTGGLEISSSEGTTQGDPIAMPCYALGIIPLMSSIAIGFVKHAAFADDLFGAGDLDHLRKWWDAIVNLGPYMGYYAKASKSWLIVKGQYYEIAKIVFENSGLNITTEGRKHLGAVVGSTSYKNSFINSLIDDWIKELQVLSEIARTEPHAAYSAFIHGLQHSYTYFMRTIQDISIPLKRLDEHTV